MPSYSNRQTEILARVRKAGKCAIETLSRDFQVSSQTIRRDVNQLCELGELRRIRGGVTLPPVASSSLHGVLGQPLSEVLTSSTGMAALEARDNLSSMGKELVELIPDGASLAIVSSPIMVELIQTLQTKSGLKIFTNDLSIALIASQRKGWQVSICGGAVQTSEQQEQAHKSGQDNRPVNGPKVAEFFTRFEMDFALLQATAISDQGNLLERGEEEAENVRAVLTNARQSLLLADKQALAPSAHAPSAHVRAAHLDQINHIIGDYVPPQSMPPEPSNARSLREPKNRESIVKPAPISLHFA